ncbi:MAG: LacI family DNA-binding transcriptional regulator [Alphaproteobacteria bacterium]|nr:LacI family DNA-binding transcriptional regulator [Alphaproteobacteria bacterium]
MATIYDVAKLAGVSPKTVSRVINGDAPVNSKTRETVELAIAELNYVPSKAARSMRSQRSGLIGLITGAISSTSAGEPAGLPDIHIVQGAQRVLADNGMTVLISDTGDKPERVSKLVQTLLEHRVEGLIYVAEFHQKLQLPILAKGFPLVLANCFDDLGTAAVLPDDKNGQYELTKGLIEKGHSRIGFLTVPESILARELRLDGYKQALNEYGIAYDPELVITAALSDDAHEFDLLWDSIDRLLNTPIKPTVICCANDKMAMRVYGLLRERGIRLPEQMSLTGYDNYRVICDHLHPTLTSAELPYEAIGARAAEKLLAMIKAGKQPIETSVDLVSGPVIWRESVTAEDSSVLQFKSTRRSEK